MRPLRLAWPAAAADRGEQLIPPPSNATNHTHRSHRAESDHSSDHRHRARSHRDSDAHLPATNVVTTLAARGGPAAAAAAAGSASADHSGVMSTRTPLTSARDHPSSRKAPESSPLTQQQAPLTNKRPHRRKYFAWAGLAFALMLLVVVIGGRIIVGQWRIALVAAREEAQQSWPSEQRRAVGELQQAD